MRRACHAALLQVCIARRAISCAALTRRQAIRSRFQQRANTCHPAFEGLHVGLPSSNQPSGASYCAIRRDKSHRPRRVDLGGGGRMPATWFAAVLRSCAQTCAQGDQVHVVTLRDQSSSVAAQFVPRAGVICTSLTDSGSELHGPTTRSETNIATGRCAGGRHRLGIIDMCKLLASQRRP